MVNKLKKKKNEKVGKKKKEKKKTLHFKSLTMEGNLKGSKDENTFTA